MLGDKGYTGAGDHVRVPYRGKNKPASQKDANRAHARLQRRSGRMADQIVLFSAASVDGARRASATLDWLQAHRYRDLVRHAVMVLSVVRPRSKSTVGLGGRNSISPPDAGRWSGFRTTRIWTRPPRSTWRS